MYGKHFACTYTGSMYGSGVTVFAVWGYAIANKDATGRVELNPRLLAGVLGGDETSIRSAIASLCEPDPESRRSDFEGRRMIHEGGFQYFLTGAAHYSAIKHPDDMREYNREAQRRSRERRRQADCQDVKQDVKKSNAQSMLSPHKDTDKDEDIDKDNTRSPPARSRSRSGTVSVDNLVAEGVNPQHARDWFTVRADKRAKHLTITAWSLFKVEAERAGMTPAQAVEHAAASGWVGFKAHWVWADGVDRKERASEAFAAIWSAAQRGHQPKLDQAGEAALAAMGGMQRYRMARPDRESFERAAFIEAYKA